MIINSTLCTATVYRILGTPNEEVWPGVSTLQDWNDSFPEWPPLQICNFVRSLNPAGIHLIEVLLLTIVYCVIN